MFDVAGATFRGGKWFGDSKNNSQHIIPSFINSVLEGESIKIMGSDCNTSDGTPIRDFVHIEDVCMAQFMALKLLKHPEYESSCFNIGSGHAVSVGHLAILVCDRMAENNSIVHEQQKQWDPEIVIANIIKADYLLGWQPQKTILDILKSSIDFQIQIRKEV